jgi:hypothetical protein
MDGIGVRRDTAFTEFQAAFEDAVPVFDPSAIAAVRQAGGTWDDIAAAVDRIAPNGPEMCDGLAQDSGLAQHRHHNEEPRRYAPRNPRSRLGDGMGAP